jgi:hypothetical protein
MNQEPADKSRRAFFRRFLLQTVENAAGVLEEFHGRPQMRLEDLNRLPDHVLCRIVPVFNANVEYRLNHTAFCIKDRKTSDFLELLPLENGDLDILSLFDRDLTLEQIAAQIEADDSPVDTAAYPRVKTLFLKLARYAVCYPAQSLVEEIGESGW